MDRLWPAQKSNNTTWVQIGEVVPPDHFPTGDTVVAYVSVEVPQQDDGIPGKSTFQNPSQCLQEGRVLCTIILPVG